jgi:hypothetical protein
MSCTLCCCCHLVLAGAEMLADLLPCSTRACCCVWHIAGAADGLNSQHDAACVTLCRTTAVVDLTLLAQHTANHSHHMLTSTTCFMLATCHKNMEMSMALSHTLSYAHTAVQLPRFLMRHCWRLPTCMQEAPGVGDSSSEVFQPGPFAVQLLQQSPRVFECMPVLAECLQQLLSQRGLGGPE